MPKSASKVSSSLHRSQRHALLRSLWRSRLGDLREQSLIRQGKGWFHISGMGHEALAAVALHMEPDDYAFPYYRDRAFCLQRGLTDEGMALAFYAKRESSSGGRQLTGHFSDRALNIWSHPSPVGAHLLPACGAAWGMQLDAKKNVVYASLGEASARQGDFFEAVCFAKERKLPIIFVVEDNRIAISTKTTETNPIALGVLNPEEWRRVDGSDVDAVAAAAKEAVAHARAGHGPAFIWCDVERFSNHSSADDQRMYRAEDELGAMHLRDPIQVFQRSMIKDGLLTEAAAQALEEEIREEIREAYRQAGGAQDPLAEEYRLHLAGELSVPDTMPALELGESCRMLDAVNKTFHSALDTMPEVVFFGEDIADPKGGVFNLTKGLSTKDPARAVNSPLAESTIMGVSVGLASYGKRPCFEIQFVDFIYPGWNQLVSNMATLRWRSFGHWKCPLVIYAPCGGYLPGGALWHSQAGEASFARVPGIHVVVPSTPEDAAGLFWTALHGEDPTIILLPKHLMWAEQKVKEVAPVPLGQARSVREGSLLTLVTWGNCVELVEEALDAMDADLDVELIDLRSIQPWDREAIAASIQKTGRLIIVQEDNISASVGQMIVAEMCGRHDVLQRLKSPPVIVSKEDVHVGFNPIYEYAALPDRERITAALEKLLASSLHSALEQNQVTSSSFSDRAAVSASAQTAPTMIATEDTAPATSTKMITVPILGEGIRVARVVTILKQSGEAVKADDPLCEVETDKAVFPIECDEDGVLGEWLIAEEDEVQVGQDLIPLTMQAASVTPAAADASAAAPIPYDSLKRSGGLSQEVLKQLQGIVPATIEMTCRWEVVRDARLRSKKTAGGTLSTATMCGWAVLQAMKKHERFASVVRGEGLVYDPERFDLGMAVALPGDALETAVVKNADKLDWDAFPDVFNEALRHTRHGEVESKNRVPLTISSMGAYNVRSAIPIVVPPSIATLFIGAPYQLPDPKSKDGGTMEVASLVLTFDHRWINGVGAASFLADVRKGIERFDLV